MKVALNTINPNPTFIIEIEETCESCFRFRNGWIISL
jgi:hypothetical protein